MSLQTSLLARSASKGPGEVSPYVDVGSILLRLLLFDRYVLDSMRLSEIPVLVDRLGYGQTLDILQSGAIELYLDAVTTGETGRATVLASRKAKGALPFGCYCFQTVAAAYRRDFVSGCFREWVDPIPIAIKDRQRMKHAILDIARKAPIDLGHETISGLRSDLLSGEALATRAVVLAAKEKTGKELQVDDLELRVHAIDEQDFATETNLGQLLGLDAQSVHEIVKRAFLNLAGLNQRIVEMERFEALSGFRDTDLPLFEEKLFFVVSAIDPDKQLERAQRVLALTNLPDLSAAGIDYQLDVQRFLRVRDSLECREFREWLPTIDGATDREVVERVSSLNSRIASVVKSPIGEVVRFLAVTGLGLVPVVGPLASAAASAVDRFLVERLLRESGITAFVGAMFPALIKSQPE